MFEQTATKQPHFATACALFAARYAIADVAREAGIGEQMLRNKLNPDQPHQLTVRDLVALYHATGDDTLFDGLLFDCGLTAVHLPVGDAAIRPEARAQQSLNVGAQILGVTAQATTLLSSGHITKVNRNSIATGLWAGIEHLVLLVTEVEHKFQAVPSLSRALGMAHVAAGA